jgi:hypothetical protein
MRVAILLTGQLRTFEMLKHLHMNALIKQYNADVFLGIDVNNKYQHNYQNSTNTTSLQEVNNAIDFFKPIDTFILNDYAIFKKNHYSHLVFRQYYVVKKVYKMLKKYSDNNNITYDLIIRLRFDQYIYSKEVPIAPGIYNTDLNTILYNQENIDKLKNFSIDKKFIFEEVNNNTIYVFGFGDFKHYKYANDQFFYHDHSLLETIMNFYDNMFDLDIYCNDNKIGNEGARPECIFYLYITLNNIAIKKTNIEGIFIRQLL